MCRGRFTLSTHSRQEGERHLKTARQLGHLRQVQSRLAILAVMDGQSCAEVAVVLRVPARTVAAWVRVFGCDGLQGSPCQKPTGRPPKLTPAQSGALAKRMDEGSGQAGRSGACWRSPMIQPLIYARFGVFSNVFSIAQALRPRGCSDPKAAFVSDHRDEYTRHAWCPTTGPQMMRLANARKARLLWGDEASFPPWGTLTDTWARRGQHPKVQTSGKRQGSTVCGVIEDFTGRFFYPGQVGRLNSTASRTVLQRVPKQTTQPILLIQDGAKYHPRAETQAFFAQQTARLTIFQLPPYSPAYNPLEKLWQPIKHADTHWHYFPTCEALTERVAPALRKCAPVPDAVLALCGLPTAWAKVA
jgi:transposase